jgi:glycosyltransferase involved in cell wall biosynthesis
MRVLLVHNFYQLHGGEDAVVRNEYCLLRSKGHEVELYQAHNDDIRSFGDKAAALFGVLYNLQAKRRLGQKLGEWRPDIVHVHNFFPLFSPSIFDACLDAGIPSVMTLHNFRILCPTALLYHDGAVCERSLQHSCWWTVPRRVYRNSFLGTLAVASMVEYHKRASTWKTKVNRFIALTEFGKAKFIEGGLPAERIVVKGNAVQPAGVGDALGGSRAGALFVGRLSDEKGIRVLLSAWSKMKEPLEIVGDGPLMSWVRANASDNIHVHGTASPETVRRKMLSSRFLVLPSTCYETFGMVVIEASACGLPSLVSDTPTLKEIVQSGVTGVHFRAGDALSLREAAKWLFQDERRLREMGLAAFEMYHQRFTMDSNYQKLITIYEGAIADQRG